MDFRTVKPYKRPGMRVIVLYETPGSAGLQEEFEVAAMGFNRSLDIRLRFLDVGFELRSLAVAEDAAAPGAELADLIGSFRPGVVLALGGGHLLLECAATAVKEGVPIAFLLNGAARRPARAIAQLAEILVVSDPAGPEHIRTGALTHVVEPNRPLGTALVDILIRSVRERRS